MNNVSLKKALILSLPILSFNMHADVLEKKEVLAQQCQDLSVTVASLISSQARTTCAERLGMASVLIEKAGYLILDYAYSSAQNELTHAVSSLRYAELNSCNRYIQISHSKFEAQKIKNSL
ncbi:hypothetical protein [Legionella maioricensis]|uniref:Uncharacterized protein n=1 Tax=Legionella maioricensis TaxID=2896528 RepID=A0A9X2D2F1_9GAMM|nr:hypothetical protein [Legionella maioricensis]MCL9684810.1 hypothetical protein [Legionella maioricensis]MCL9687788.1 hypothetical protein [Legionella maioricensis]